MTRSTQIERTGESRIAVARLSTVRAAAEGIVVGARAIVASAISG